MSESKTRAADRDVSPLPERSIGGLACGIARPSESRVEESQGLLIGWSLAWSARRSSAREEGFYMALCDLEDQLFLHCYLSSSLLERKKNFTPGKSLPSSSFCRFTMSPSQRQEREEPGGRWERHNHICSPHCGAHNKQGRSVSASL